MAELKSNSTLGANLIATGTSVSLQAIVDAPWDNTFSTSLLVAYRNNNAITWHGSDDKSVFITSPPIYSPAVYSLSSNVSSVSEGGSVQFDLSTYKISDGTVFYYDVVSLTGSVTANDFSSSASGNFNVTANSGNVILTLANDKTTEGTESFKLQVRTDNASGNIVATSNVIVIDVSLDPTYALSSNVSSVPEGSNVLVTLTTTGVDQGTTIPYTISGVTTDDFDPALSSLTGNFTADSNGSDTLELSVAADANSSENESIIVTLGATDSAGFSTGSPSVSIGVEEPISGQNAYTSSGTYSFVVPEGVFSVSAVTVGGGGGGSGFPTGTTYKWPGSGGGGGGLAWATFDVTPGESLDVIVGYGGNGGLNSSGLQAGKSGTAGGDSYIARNTPEGAVTIIRGGGGGAGTWSYQSYQTISGGSVFANTSLVTSYGLYNGGMGGASGGFNSTGGGGGGAGGYANASVTISGSWSRGGGYYGIAPASSGYPGSGAAAGGGWLSGAPANSSGYGGGGVGILGRGSTGVAVADGYGEGGSGGANATSASGGLYGGGGGAPGGPTNNSGGGFGGNGRNGAVRIIYGPGRSYPDTNTADQ